MSGDTLFLPDKSRVFQTGDHKEITGDDYTEGGVSKRAMNTTSIMKGIDGAGDVQDILVDASGQPQVEVTSSTLPAGAATNATLDTIKTVLDTIESNTDGLELSVDNIDLNTDTLEAIIATTNTNLNNIETNQTDKSQFTQLVGGTDGTTPIGNVGDGLNVNVASFAEGITTDFLLDIASGSKDGIGQVNKFGYNSSVGNIALEDIWDGSTAYTFPTAAETVEVTSSDDDDTSLGTGARTVEIQGLDGSYNVQTETITMDGTADATSVNSYLRIFRMKVLTAGTQGENDGDITATQTTSGILMAQITAEQNQTLMCIYTIPAGKTGYLTDLYYTVSANKEFEADLFVRPENQVFQIKHKVILSAPFEFAWRPYLKIDAKSDVRVKCKASTGSAEIGAGFDLILVDN